MSSLFLLYVIFMISPPSPMQVSLLIPECGVLPADIAKVIGTFSSYYFVRDLPVYRFLEEDMLDIIKKGKAKTAMFYNNVGWLFLFWLCPECFFSVFAGSLYALSYKTRLDEDNTIALLSSKYY